LREEHRLRVFGKRVLRIFELEREEDRSWRKLHNDELHNLYSSPNILLLPWHYSPGWALASFTIRPLSEAHLKVS
jgi:hypothetical protein